MKEWILILVLNGAPQASGPYDLATCTRMLLEETVAGSCVHRDVPMLSIVRTTAVTK